jgi:hypothetical protein
MGFGSGLRQLAADVVESGSVLGLDHVSSPEQVAAVLGCTEGETRGSGELFRDHGLLEFAWQREGAGSPWRGVRMSAQLHRPAGGRPCAVEAALVERYGPLRGPLPFEELAAEAARRGTALVEVPGAGPGSRAFWAPQGLVSVLVLDGDAAGGPGGVHALHTPTAAEWVAWRGAPDAYRAHRDRVDALAAAPPARADAWPGPDAGPEVYRRVLATLRRRGRERPDLSAGASAAYGRVLARARERGVLDPAEAAVLAALGDGEPEAVVRDCLAAMPGGPAVGAELRRGRDLLAAARRWAPRLAPGDLSDRLHAVARRWGVDV